MLVVDVLCMLRSQLTKTWGLPGNLSPTFQIDTGTRNEFLAKADWIENQVKAAYFAPTDAEKHRLWKAIFNDQIPLS